MPNKQEEKLHKFPFKNLDETALTKFDEQPIQNLERFYNCRVHVHVWPVSQLMNKCEHRLYMGWIGNAVKTSC